MHDPTRTLEELEGDQWPPPNFDSHLVKEAHRLRSIPIGELTTEDLRLLLGQQIGVKWLMPLALDLLMQDAMAMRDFYPGDLLVSVLHVDASYWDDHPNQLHALYQVRVALEAVRDAAARLLTDEGWPAFG